MPSASSKLEKPASTEAVDPLRQAIIILEHKIRNLEKRKTKLDSYKESVKPLTKDQIEAVSKYDEVLQQLELSKEYVKQFNSISIENDKIKKKNARKEAQERFLTDASKIKQVLQIQDILQNIGTETVKEDFLNGLNGATSLTEAELKTLDDLFGLLTPKSLSEENMQSKNDQLQKIAENYLAIIEGKQKELVGMSCAKLKELVISISSCGYFDKPIKDTNVPSETHHSENLEEEETEFRESQEILSNVIVPSQNPAEGNVQVQNTSPKQPILQGAPVIPPANQPPLMPTNPPQIVPQNISNIVPTPVSQVESTYFNAQGVKPRAPQPAVPPSVQTRQINEVIQSITGKFNFLRESELELSEMGPPVVPANTSVATPQIPATVPTGIPTRTFTNQNFNGQPAGAPNFPPAYPPQLGTFQTFVPAFPAFVGPSNSPTTNSLNNTNNNNNNNNSNNNNNNNNSVNNISNINSGASNIAIKTTTAATSTTIDNMKNNNNGNNIHNNGNINNAPSKTSSNHSSNVNKSSIHNTIPVSSSRNPNIVSNQGQPQIATCLPMQPTQAGSQPPNQQNFQHANVPSNPLGNPSIEETVHPESEKKDKRDNHRQDWNQQENTNWSDDWTESSEWKSNTQNETATTQTKFSTSRVNRNGTGGPRNSNSYQGNRNRINRPGGYRDQNNQGIGGGNSNFYQNQNGFQSRSERNNDYPPGGKGNSDFRDNTFKERGDFNNRDRDNYSGGFKRGPRNPNIKGPMDRGDRVGQVQRNHSTGSRPPRNLNRQTNLGNGPSYPRQHPNHAGQTK